MDILLGSRNRPGIKTNLFPLPQYQPHKTVEVPPLPTHTIEPVNEKSLSQTSSSEERENVYIIKNEVQCIL